MSPSCIEKEFGYFRRSGVQDARSWKDSHACAAAVIRKHRGEWESKPAPGDIDHAAELRRLFGDLAEEWKSDTWHTSSVRRRISHPAYLKIIGMGKEALPFIFEDMRKEPSHWFWALEAITRENIAPEATSLSEVHNTWLDWAKSHGY
jgi:hypothetical protein